MTSKDVAIRVRQVRKQKSFSVKQLAFEMGVNPSTISNWELGKSEMKLSHFLRLCNVLNVKPSEMLNPPTRPRY